MTIHDHFDGSAHCVECKGLCQLKGDDLEVTRLIRYVMEQFMLTERGWIPPFVEEPIRLLLGKRWAEFRAHCRVTTEAVGKPR